MVTAQGAIVPGEHSGGEQNGREKLGSAEIGKGDQDRERPN